MQGVSSYLTPFFIPACMVFTTTTSGAVSHYIVWYP